MIWLIEQWTIFASAYADKKRRGVLLELDLKGLGSDDAASISLYFEKSNVEAFKKISADLMDCLSGKPIRRKNWASDLRDGEEVDRDLEYNPSYG